MTDTAATSPGSGPDDTTQAEGEDLRDVARVPDTEVEQVGYASELVEVFPNVVAVLGALPTELEGVLEPLNTGLLSVLDHNHIDRALAVVGNTATVGGNLAHAASGMQGLYKIADESQALLNAGGKLAAKDGKNLGTIVLPKGSPKSLAQARFTPATGLTAATAAAAIGPALAMVALQAQLNQVSTLVEKNIELTSQVIESSRRTERATLMSLVDTIDQALEDARAAESVPRSLWDTVASKKANLDAERKKYRANVEAHINKITTAGVHQRREYLQANAKSVVFDTFALLATMKAWTGYQAIAAAVAREAGADNPAEAKHFESIVVNTRRDFEADMSEATRLVGSLTRELRIIVELPGPTTLKLSSKRKNADAARKISKSVLDAIAPLSDALLSPRRPLETPEVVCVPTATGLDPYLRILRWLLEPDEQVRCLGFGNDAHSQGRVTAVVGAAKDKIAIALDKDPAQLLVAVTDRRILTTDTHTFLKMAVFNYAVNLDEVRYVRSTQIPGEAKARRVDLITREDNHEWHFGPDVDAHDVDALAAILAESMTLPEQEREDLRRRHSPIEGPKNDPRTPDSDGAATGASAPGALAPPTHTPTADD
ncbi:MAG: hypothetical protein HHJ11_11880 [Phycicoccus sp.]|nr:hypothetical protein [Phycicoccus sp.]